MLGFREKTNGTKLTEIRTADFNPNYMQSHAHLNSSHARWKWVKAQILATRKVHWLENTQPASTNGPPSARATVLILAKRYPTFIRLGGQVLHVRPS